jgi:dsRNA-specific ribonuclease
MQANYNHQVLSDMLEAIIGAIYVSDGFKLEAAEHFYTHVLRPFYLRYVDSEDLAIHPTRKLTDIFDAHGCHRFEITKEKDEIASNRVQYVSEGMNYFSPPTSRLTSFQSSFMI